LPCAGSKTHGKHELFVVRLPEKRTANRALCHAPGIKTHGNKWHLCRAPWRKTHGKGTVLVVGFGHFAVRLPEDARQSDHCNLFFLVFHV
jgi:hypothetical protein